MNKEHNDALAPPYFGNYLPNEGILHAPLTVQMNGCFRKALVLYPGFGAFSGRGGGCPW